MKASLYPGTKLSGLPSGIESLHLVRPVGRKKIASVLKRLPGIERISMSKSCFERTSPNVKKFLAEKEVGVSIRSERGRAISIPLEKMQSVIEMRRDFRPLREIEKTTGIPKSTVHYLVKYSQKKKVKNGKNVVYLTQEA